MLRRTFKAQVVDIILDAIKTHCNVSRHIDTSFSSRNTGFYFQFNRYGQQLHIMVYPSGNLGIKVKEMSHADQQSNYYEFGEDDNHEELLTLIRQDFDMLIQDFYKGMDYPQLVDQHICFTLARADLDWREVYERIRA